ncbi:MAG: hypothetical protein IJV65_06140 [Kiritimatiellae bacterium]|nr:hypothetical protein [Kiritimatiellia bacterium]
MKTNIQTALAILVASWAGCVLADGEPTELVPLASADAGWRVSVGVRAAPKLKTKATAGATAALAKAGRVKAASAGGPSAAGGTVTETSESTTTEDGGTETSGTTKDEAKAASGYKDGVTRYDFDNGYIDLEDAAGQPGQTTNWHFDDAGAFDATGLSVSGTKNYEETKKTKTRTRKTKTTKTKETTVADSAARSSFRETFADGPADSGSEHAEGLEIQIGRLVYENESFGVEANAGYTLYKDVDCFSAGGRVYTGRASASRGSVETKTTTTTQTDVTETTTTTTESGSFATVLSQPEFTDLDDIRNPDGSIGGASYDGQPVQTGWTTAILTVTPDRFSVVANPGASSTSTESATTEGTPETATSTSRSPGASVSRSRAVDVRSTGELSLQELRLGASPFWKAADWLRVKADLGLVGSHAEVETHTTVLADGSAVWSKRHSDDEWNLQGYAGLSVAVLPTDGLELAAGAEARFPKRKIRFDDGIVSGSTELPSWDAFVSVGIRF